MTPDPLALKAWAFFVAAMGAKMYGNALIQAATRLKAQHFTYPEDQAAFGRQHPAAPLPPEHDRASACWRNDLENIPMFTLLALASALLSPRHTLLIGCLAAYATARIAHTAFMLAPRQPHRSIAYNAGTLIASVLAIDLLAAVLAS